MSHILTSIHGRKGGFDKDGDLISGRSFRAGYNGKQRVFGSPAVVEFWDDFLGDVVADQWNALEGSDSATSDAAILAGGIGGVLRFTTGDVTGVTAANVLANVEEYVQALQWQASNGGLTFECRIALSSITTSFCFVGFTDLAASAELPIEGSGTADGLTTNASDAVGFLFDVRMTTKDWWLTGVAANTDATAVDSGVAPVAAAYNTLRVEVDASGDASFFIDGVNVGYVASAVTAATDLTPVIAVSKAYADTVSITADLDYVHVAMAR